MYVYSNNNVLLSVLIFIREYEYIITAEPAYFLSAFHIRPWGLGDPLKRPTPTKYKNSKE
jgi:hypothetical protein